MRSTTSTLLLLVSYLSFNLHGVQSKSRPAPDPLSHDAVKRISEWSHRRHEGHHTERSLASRSLPGNWTSLGCITDNTAARSLTGSSYTDTSNMTVESCIAFCAPDYIYAGVEYASQCYCDNAIHNGATNATSSDCNMACTGNADETCGAGNRINLYWSGAAPPPPPVIPATIGNWISLGCYNDSTGARSLSYGAGVTGNFTLESCTAACYAAGYNISGSEYADQCYCDSDLRNGATSISLDSCDMTCAGNSGEYCGGPNALTLYYYNGTVPTPAAGVGGGGGGGGGGATSSSVYPVTSGLPSPWNYSGCWVDNANGRIFIDELNDNSNVTVESCIASCDALNYTLAGIEYSVQCFCGNALLNGATLGEESSCNMPCGGNSTEACGGPNRLSVYSSTSNVTVYPVPVAQTTNLPGEWQYQGCYAEPGANRVFPYQNILSNNNSAEACLNLCAAYGYPAAGMEYTDECWCGDVSDVATNGGLPADSGCDMPCSGDPDHLCGGPQRLQLYYWGGPNGSIANWHYPENTGYYEYFIGGLVVPLISTLGINNKVTFLEKSGTSLYPNSTGAYELDISLVPEPNSYLEAWRTMHVKTDIFCSGSIILPDVGGRQINVGGWSLTSTFGVRLYTPDGTYGVNGTNDWEENADELQLQRGRWYPTALMMANGSILIVGGETGANGPPQPNLEILPRTPGGDTVVFLDFMNRTDPYNLYPFLHVMPTGDIFIGYYNEARLLDPVTFETVKELPNIPGAVNNFLAGRTYPMEGTSVLLPQYAPYTDPVTVLICGGSTIGAAIALDNCVSTQPTVENSTWTIERMPSQRVMTCMVALPDGRFMIMNGAHQGVAGFGLASDPNLGAIMYDPSQPVNSRFSVLNDTIVARMYHSEAALLNDGRILVSGSDPQTYYPNGTEVYPEEFRIEVYYPDYLTAGNKQPEFSIADDQIDWKYGGEYTINNITFYQGDLSGARISLISAVSSTHGNSMGGRTLFPAFTCSGNSCTITAPPNANVSPPCWYQLFILDGPTPSRSKWVRIGGDPASLGNWPAYPDFTTPGLTFNFTNQD